MLIRPTTQTLLEEAFEFALADSLRECRFEYPEPEFDKRHIDVMLGYHVAKNMADAIDDMWHMGIIPATDFKAIFPNKKAQYDNNIAKWVNDKLEEVA